MSEDRLMALLAKLNDDPRLREKLNGASDLESFLALAKEAGFEISAEAYKRLQARRDMELSDAIINNISGGVQQSFMSEDWRGF